jgi:menaquinone-dependent protoporphyrinogen oxidase
MIEKKKSSRRRFLKIAGGTLVATAAVGGGLIALGTRQPKIEFKESNYGGTNDMSERILVAYASRCGSTGEVADVIGQELNAKGVTVDVQLVKNVTDLSPYKAVIIGSAIRMGSWLSEAKKFIKTHQQTLQGMPIAYFAVCGSLKEDTEENRREALGYVEPMCKILKPVDVGVFAGVMDYSKLSFLSRLIITKLIKSPEGDFRNWETIRTWANNVHSALLSGVS